MLKFKISYFRCLPNKKKSKSLKLRLMCSFRKIRKKADIPGDEES
jgi:hypothetical protein